jgi:hypothetical protein
LGEWEHVGNVDEGRGKFMVLVEGREIFLSFQELKVYNTLKKIQSMLGYCPESRLLEWAKNKKLGSTLPNSRLKVIAEAVVRATVKGVHRRAMPVSKIGSWRLNPESSWLMDTFWIASHAVLHCVHLGSKKSIIDFPRGSDGKYIIKGRSTVPYVQEGVSGKHTVEFLRKMRSIGAVIGTLICDRGSEFFANSVYQFCKDRDITLCFSNVASPQSNGIIERRHSLLREIYDRLALDQRFNSVPIQSMVEECVHVVNNTSMALMSGLTPDMVYYGKEYGTALLISTITSAKDWQ